MPKPKDRGLQPDEIRDRIRTSRSMQALQEAKRWAKEHPGPAAEALLAEAYSARIDAFARSGMRREVDELLKVARERLPSHAAEWERRASASVWRTGNIEGVLREWARADQPEPRRKELAELIERELRDPAHLIHNALPAQDPLRLAAEAVATALREAADGALSAAARERLKQVGRRSPLAPWRSMALALAAFHGGDDDTCRALLASLAPGSAVAKLAPVLLAELDRAPRAAAGPLEKALVARLHGKAGDLLGKAGDLGAALARGEKAGARRALEALLDGLFPVEFTLAERLVLWIVERPDRYDWLDDDALDSCFLKRLPRDEYWRIDAQLAGADSRGRWLSFATWLLPSPTASMRSLSEITLAQALDRLLEDTEVLWAEAVSELALRDDVSRRVVLTPKGAELHLEGSVVPGWMDIYLCIQAQLLASLRKRHAGRFDPDPLADPTAELMFHRACLDPETQHMLAGVKSFEAMPSRPGLGAFLALWTELAPESADAWLALARHEHGQGAPEKASAAIERAKALDSVNADVRALQFEIALSVLREHLEGPDDRLVAQALERVRALPAAATPERKRYLAALAVGLALPGGKRARRAEAEAYLEATVASEVECHEALRLASTEVPGPHGKRLAEPIGDSPRARWESLARLVILAEAVDRSRLACIVAGGLDRDVRPEDMPADRQLLLALCRFARQSIDTDMEYVASGAGLREDSPELLRFLVHRASSLVGVDRARAGDLVRLAIESAQRRRDATLVRYLAATAPELPGRDATSTLGARVAEGLLAQERAAAPTLEQRRAAPRQGGPRQRRSPRKREQGPLLPFEPRQAEEGS